MNCNHQNAVCVESTGGIESGSFSEKYECDCGAIGFVEGNAGEPVENWNKYGAVFEDNQ